MTQEAKLPNRLKGLILSVYLHNEWRGVRQIEDQLIPALEGSTLVGSDFIAEVRKHAADELKHYQMFKAYFRSTGVMPFAVGGSIGYFDFLIRILMVRKENYLVHKSDFARVFRAIITTERRGISQIQTLLKWRLIKEDEKLNRIFKIIEIDEPSHFSPYETWLKIVKEKGPALKERIVDWIVHYSIAVLIIPIHFVNWRLKRLESFPDESAF